MIEYVSGTLVGIEPQYVIVDCHGLGYQLYCPNPYTFQKQWNETVTIHTYQHVREDLIRLYGFQSKAERALFEKLLSVSGIGPKGALAILATGMPEQVVSAIENEDEAFLVKFPGVGKKTARQIILDLKGKLADVATSFQPDLGDKAQTAVQPHEKSAALEEAFEALRALGYVERELKKIRPALLKEELETDAYVKKALQLLLKV